MTDMLRELAEVVRLREARILAAKAGNDEEWNELSESCEDAMESLIAGHHAEIAQNAESVGKYQSLCAAMYQVAGVYDMPVKFLDALFDAAQGEIEKRQKTDDLLPYYLPESEAAKRLRALEMAMGQLLAADTLLFIDERADKIMREQPE